MGGVPQPFDRDVRGRGWRTIPSRSAVARRRRPGDRGRHPRHLSHLRPEAAEDPARRRPGSRIDAHLNPVDVCACRIEKIPDIRVHLPADFSRRRSRCSAWSSSASASAARLRSSPSRTVPTRASGAGTRHAVGTTPDRAEQAHVRSARARMARAAQRPTQPPPLRLRGAPLGLAALAPPSCRRGGRRRDRRPQAREDRVSSLPVRATETGAGCGHLLVSLAEDDARRAPTSGRVNVGEQSTRSSRRSSRASVRRSAPPTIELRPRPGEEERCTSAC